MATHTIRIDQLDHSRLFERLFAHLVFGKEERVAIETPTQWSMWNAEIQKDVFVEIVLADNQLVHACEKRARLSALNDAMIVRAADRNRFADAELRNHFRRHRLVLCRVLDRASGDNYRLAFHQSWNRRDSAERSGIGQ